MNDIAQRGRAVGSTVTDNHPTKVRRTIRSSKSVTESPLVHKPVQP